MSELHWTRDRRKWHDALDLARVIHVLLASLGLNLLNALVVQKVAQVGVELLNAHERLVVLAFNLAIEENVSGAGANIDENRHFSLSLST